MANLHEKVDSEFENIEKILKDIKRKNNGL
jgi:hypothetical protein